MTLALTEEQLALAESVRGWAGHAAPATVIRSVVDAEDRGAAVYRDTLRPGLAAQGLLGLHLPEALGGQGAGLPELAVAAEELARALVPGSYLPTVLAGAVLADAIDAAADGADTSELESLVKELAAGNLTAAVGLGPGLSAAPGDGGALVIDGTCGPVTGASLADLLILPTGQGEAQAWVALDASDVTLTPLDSMDLTRPVARVSVSKAAVPAGRVLAGLPQGLVRGLAATLFAAEACGIAAWAVDTAASYAKIRHQFGRPIGQFQAVKHRCAWMLTASEQAAAVAWDAARAWAEPAGAEPDAGRDFAAGAAATVAIDAAVSCAHECIQVLGGIGYTWEHDAHLYYRRALSLRALAGSSGGWASQVARLALGGATRSLSVELPEEAAAVRAQVAGELAAIAAAPKAEHARLLAAG